MTTKAKDSNKPVKERYRGYLLTINRNDKGVLTVFSGKATKEIASTSDASQDIVLDELKKRIDGIEKRFKESAYKTSDQSVALAENSISEIPFVPQSISSHALSDDNSENSSIGNSNKSEIEIGEGKNNKFTEPSIVMEFEKSLNILTKEVEKINKFLDKPQPTVTSQNEILEKISYLIQATNANKSNLDEWRKDYTEKSQIQEKLLRDILNKINTVAQADHVTEHLNNLHNESKNLYDRLDKKIDLQDVEQILILKNKIEESVNNQLMISLSKKIMPVVNILKDKVVGLDTTFSKSVDDLEQRCRQAGLIPFDKLF